MHFTTLLLLTAACVVAAEYSDDNTPQKVRLEDLELEQEQRQLQHHQPQTQLQQQQQRLQLPLQAPGTLHVPLPTSYQSLQAIFMRPSLAPRPTHAPASAPIASDTTAPATGSAYEYTGYESNSLDYNGGVLPNELKEHDALRQSHAQLSGGYPLQMPQRQAYILLRQPSYEETHSAAHDVSTAQQQQPQQHQQQQQQQQLPQQHLHVQLSPATYLPPASAPPPPSTEDSVEALAPPPVDSQPSGGIQYVTSNHLPEPNGRFNAFNLLPPNKPIIVYEQQAGAPSQHITPHPPSSLPLSKQFAFAPHPREPGTLSPHAVPLPYPPSFVSITSTTPRPDNFNYYKAPPSDFKASPLDPIPDLFSYRHAKSLLDSYIPSWIVSQMIERQHQPQQLTHGVGRHTLAYIGSVPYKRHAKRNSPEPSPSDKKSSITESNNKSLKGSSTTV